MAQTQISDLVPSEKVLGNLVTALIPAKNTFINSGVAVTSDEVKSLATGGPRKQSLQYIKPLNPAEVNIGNDDADATGDTSKLTGDEFTAVRLDTGNGFKYADITSIVTQFSVRGGIQAAFAAYANGVNQKVGVSSMKGALAATSASALTIGSTSDPFSFARLIDAAATAGENMDMFKTAVVHSNTYANLLKRYKPVRDTVSGLPMIGDWRIIVDNSFGNTKTLLLRNGALAQAFGSHPQPFEIERKPGGGTGYGAETLWFRFPQVCHPQGFNFVGNVPAGLKGSAFWTALETGTNWTMELAADQVGIRAIQHSTAEIPSEVFHVNVDNIEDTPVA